jgi:glyoxylase-like metal-dependent hydrolase (beta-lactamase superfamily II)
MPLPDVPYTKGLHEVADGVWAYLQPDGGWGWSNAGLVTSGSGALLVDTLFDLRLTGEMLDTMRRATPAARNIGTVVNTHANGDHCYGNGAVSGAEIVASEACAAEMDLVRPAALGEAVRRGAAGEGGEAGAFTADIFGPFDFDGVDVVPPTRTFAGHLQLTVGGHGDGGGDGKVVDLVELGPAHTAGDVIVHVPGDGVVFTGDILFHKGHPVVWAGPVANWICACDRILALDGVEVVVPGHGPLAGLQAVADMKGYFEHLVAEASARFAAGMSAHDAAYDIDMSPYEGWGESERIVINVAAVYRDLGAEVPADAGSMFAAMAEWRAAHKGRAG